MCYNIVDKKIWKGSGIIYMKKFFNFMRHTQLLNWKIVVYSCKEIACIFKRAKLKSNPSSAELVDYTESLLKNGRLPAKAYEYDCCVEYLKKIRHCLFSSREDFSKLLIVFDEVDRYNEVRLSSAVLFFKVAEEVGFKVTDEKLLDDRSEYTLKSVF